MHCLQPVQLYCVSMGSYIDTKMRIQTVFISFKNRWTISSSYNFQTHQQYSQDNVVFPWLLYCDSRRSQVLPGLSSALPSMSSGLPDMSSVLPGLWSALPGAPKVLSSTPRCSQICPNHSHGTPVTVISDPSYSKGRLEFPPRVWYSPEIDALQFTLHVLSDTPGGSQWRKYILLIKPYIHHDHHRSQYHRCHIWSQRVQSWPELLAYDSSQGWVTVPQWHKGLATTFRSNTQWSTRRSSQRSTQQCTQRCTRRCTLRGIWWRRKRCTLMLCQLGLCWMPRWPSSDKWTGRQLQTSGRPHIMHSDGDCPVCNCCQIIFLQSRTLLSPTDRTSHNSTCHPDYPWHVLQFSNTDREHQEQPLLWTSSCMPEHWGVGVELCHLASMPRGGGGITSCHTLVRLNAVWINNNNNRSCTHCLKVLSCRRYGYSWREPYELRADCRDTHQLLYKDASEVPLLKAVCWDGNDQKLAWQYGLAIVLAIGIGIGIGNGFGHGINMHRNGHGNGIRSRIVDRIEDAVRKYICWVHVFRDHSWCLIGFCFPLSSVVWVK